MNRPDEIAALAKFIEAVRSGDFYADYDASTALLRKTMRALDAIRASATTPGDAVRALQSIAALSVEKGHTIASAQQIAADALAPAEKARKANNDPVLLRHLLKLANENVERLADEIAMRDATSAEKAGLDAKTTENVGRWLSAALDDPQVCQEMKNDILAWMQAGKPNVQPATPTPPSAEDFARVMCDADLWIGAWDEQRNALIAEGRDWQQDARIERYLKPAYAVVALIQSAAPGGGTKSDGARSSSLPSGESEPLVTTASAPSDPAQEPEAVALKPCPFCGSQNIDPKGWASTDRAGPACDDCCGSADTIERWNTRPVSLDREALPSDVVRLVNAARLVAFTDQGPEAIKQLDDASEAFASRVPWDNEPEDDAALIEGRM